MTTKVARNAALTNAVFAIVAFAVSPVFAAPGPIGQNVSKTVFEQPIPNPTVEAAHFAVERDLGRGRRSGPVGRGRVHQLRQSGHPLPGSEQSRWHVPTSSRPFSSSPLSHARQVLVDSSSWEGLQQPP